MVASVANADLEPIHAVTADVVADQNSFKSSTLLTCARGQPRPERLTWLVGAVAQAADVCTRAATDWAVAMVVPVAADFHCAIVLPGEVVHPAKHNRGSHRRRQI